MSSRWLEVRFEQLKQHKQGGELVILIALAALVAEPSST
jgi:hypothetical protein